MSELDKAWAEALAEAQRRAHTAGRGDVADYLSLRASNDQARKAAIDWLFATFMDLAGQANRAGASIQIEKQDAHEFRVGNSTMVGPLLTFRMGVRALHVEAGWPRAPRHGIVTGGGLARAQIRHFGDRRKDESLLLLRSPATGTPQWVVIEQTGAHTELLEERLRAHLNRFLGGG